MTRPLVDPGAVVRGLVEDVWVRGDLDALPAYWTEDCVNHAAPAGEQRGLTALRAYHAGFAQALAGFSDVRIEVLQQVVQGDRVATQLVTRARHTGDGLGVTATGREVALHTIRLDRVVNGSIAEHWSVADLAGLHAQLG